MCFILPAMLIVLALAWVYVTYGSTPQATALLYGIKPVIIAVIVQALSGLARVALRNRFLIVVAVATLAASLLGADELALLFGAGLLVMLVLNARRLRSSGRGLAALLPASGVAAPSIAWLSLAAAPFSLLAMFLTFLKIGAVLYGSGYVLLAFLRTDFVVRLGWLTDRQLLDAVSIGQFTRGPVFTTATFIGYVLGGVRGALLATLGIFLPSFVFVAISNPLIPHLRRSPWAGALLDGVNAAALGLMAAITLQLGRAAIVDLPSAILAVLAAILLMRYRINSAWLVIGGGLAGFLLFALR